MVKDPNTGDLVPDFMEGIPIGEYDRETRKLKIYNHLAIEVKVHLTTTEPVEKRIVGFEVHPMSRDHNDNHITRCDHKAEFTPQYLEAGTKFLWSYCYRTVVSSFETFNSINFRQIKRLLGHIEWITITESETTISTCCSSQFQLVS